MLLYSVVLNGVLVGGERGACGRRKKGREGLDE